MHPARQIRLGALMLLQFVAVLAAITVHASGGRSAQGVRGEPPQNAHDASGRPPRLEGGPAKATALSARAVWTIDLPAAPAGQPAYDAARAYLPVEMGELAALSLDTGALAWKTAVLAAGAPAAGGGLVFVPVAGAVEARDADTGDTRWSVRIEGRLSAPIVWQNGWLFLATDRGAALMLRAENGQRLWRQDLGAPVRTRAAMTGDRVYVGLENGQVRALELATGQPLWSRALRGRPTTLAPLDDRVFAGADDKFLYCLSAKDGNQDWRWRTGGSIIGTPVFDDDNVYFLSLDNGLRALDRGNGHQRWLTGLTFRPLAGPYLADGRLLVAGLVEVRAFQPTDGSEAGGVDGVGTIAAPPHFLAPNEDGDRPFILFTREGQMVRLAPAPPPLPSKPFPATMIYPLWPGTGEESEGSRPRAVDGSGLEAQGRLRG